MRRLVDSRLQTTRTGGTVLVQNEMETILPHRAAAYCVDESWQILFLCAGRVPRAPVRLQIDWDWKQEWENQKGSLKLDVIRNGEEIASKDLSLGCGANRTWEHRTVVINDARFLASLRIGDALRVQRLMGGEVCPELYVTNFRIYFGSIGKLLEPTSTPPPPPPSQHRGIDTPLVVISEARPINYPLSLIRGIQVASSFLSYSSKVIGRLC